MKKIVVAVLVVVLALGAFAGVAAAKSSVQGQVTQAQTGFLHDYMEKALAEKLNLDLNKVEAEFDAGKTLYQIAIDHGIAQADVQAFMLEVRTQALKAAVADGVIAQTQADWMLSHGGRGMGSGMGYGMRGNGACGTGGMMQRGGRWQQTNP